MIVVVLFIVFGGGLLLGREWAAIYYEQRLERAQLDSEFWRDIVANQKLEMQKLRFELKDLRPPQLPKEGR